MLTRWLERVALFSRRRYRLVFAVVVLALATSAWLSLDLELDTEVLNLLPADDPIVKTFRSTIEDFGSLDVLLVLVRVPEGEVLDPYFEYVDRLGAALEELDTIEYVDYRIGEIDEMVETLFPTSLFLLDEEGRRDLAERLSDEGIRNRVQEIRRLISTPQSLALRDLLLLDPIGIAEVFVDQLVGNRGALKVDWSQGYFVSADRQRILLIAKPTEPAQEVEFGRRLAADVSVVLDELGSRWPEIAELELTGEDTPAPDVALGGTYVTALQDAGQVIYDVVLGLVTSLVGVLTLFYFAFRRVGLIFYAFFPLATGLCLAFGFAAAAFGGLNAATSGFAALLVGLGIDFVIVSYGRYVEERNAGASLSEALRSMSATSGRAVVTGAVTTAATFYAFGVTDFTGLRQMGFLTGTGILFCMVAVLTLLPAMLAWSEDRSERRSRGVSLRLHALGVSRLIAWSYRHPRPVLAVALVLSVAAGWLAPRIEFEDSIREMRPQGNEGVEVQDEVAEAFGSGFDYMMLVARAPTEGEVLELAARAESGARSLVDAGVLNGFDGIGTLVPPASKQAAVVEWLDEHRSLFDASRLRGAFDETARAEGLRPEPFYDGLDLLSQAADARETITPDDVANNPQARRLLDRYIRETADGFTSVVYLYPPPRIWKRSAPPEAHELAAALGPNVQLSGVNLVSERLRNGVRTDATLASIVGFFIVALLLWLDYRRVGDTIISLSPLVVGLLWMLGIMALFGLDMNFFNVFVITMIIGIGVDYGVHTAHRYRECLDEGTDLLSGLQETGRAIVLAALSTSVGFGSLSISHYPGLRSMGFVAILGAATTALVAVTILPAALSLMRPTSSPSLERT